MICDLKDSIYKRTKHIRETQEKSFQVTAFLFAAILVFALSVTTAEVAAQPLLEIVVGDTTAFPNQQNTQISVFMSNFSDSVAAIELWLQLDRPDLILFQVNTDTIFDTTYWNCNAGTPPNCTDTTQVFDTTLGYDYIQVVETEVELGNHDVSGTLMSTWESVTSRSLGGIGADLKIIAFADALGGPVVPGFAPQSNGVVIKLLANVLDVPDTATQRTVKIFIRVVPLDNFSISDPDGNSIGIITESVEIPIYWQCESMIGDTCVSYVKIPSPPYDSISYDTVNQATLDTSRVFLTDGSVTVLVPPPCLCGDADGSGDVNIGDAIYLIFYIFLDGSPPMCAGSPNLFSGDADGSGSINIGDALFLVKYIFNDGPTPENCSAS